MPGSCEPWPVKMYAVRAWATSAVPDRTLTPVAASMVETSITLLPACWPT